MKIIVTSTLVADVVRSYTQVCAANEELAIANESLDLLVQQPRKILQLYPRQQVRVPRIRQVAACREQLLLGIQHKCALFDQFP